MQITYGLDEHFKILHFQILNSAKVCQGRYDNELIRAWEHWDNKHSSENDHPKEFPEDQVVYTTNFSWMMFGIDEHVQFNLELNIAQKKIHIFPLFFSLTVDEIVYSVMSSLFKNMEDKILKALCFLISMKQGVCWFRSLFFYMYLLQLYMCAFLFNACCLVIFCNRLQLPWLWERLLMNLNTEICIGLVFIQSSDVHLFPASYYFIILILVTGGIFS